MTKWMIWAVMAASAVCNSADASAACTMNPPPLSSAEIAKRPTVRAVVFDRQSNRSDGLLKDGRTFRVQLSGCDRSGVTAALWMRQSSVSEMTHAQWVAEAVRFGRNVLSKEIANDIAMSATKEWRSGVGSHEGRLVFDLTTPEGISIQIVVVSSEVGVQLVIYYAAG
ncbi:MAG: hypothetical protein QM776_05075 [Rhodocyclaceae bacterium]